jgi:hypothetical protein
MRQISFPKAAKIAILIALGISSCKQARYGVNRLAASNEGQPAPATPAPVIDQIDNTPTGVTFGTTGVFHLGDANFGGSTCKSKLAALPLSGLKLNFTFEVTSPNTPVQISITDLCGVDLDNNLVYVASDNMAIAPVAVPVNATTMDLQPLTLDPGVYTLTIVSGKNLDNPKYTIGNPDDIIVGHVQVVGQNIRGVSYGAAE